MAQVDPEAVLQMVQRWRERPKGWRRLVRELLVVLWKIRPVVFLDEIAFASVEAVETFIVALNARFAAALCILTFSNDADDFARGSPSVFVADAAALEAWSDVTLPVWVSPRGRRLDAEENERTQIWIVDVLTQLRRLSLSGKVHLKLDPFCAPLQFPTLAGVLLDYPVVYVQSASSNEICVTDCAVFRVILRLRSLPHVFSSPLLFSFTVPVSLLDDLTLQEALWRWKRRLSRQMECVRTLYDTFEIEEHRTELLALRF